MAYKKVEKKSINQEETWADSFTLMLKMWEDSFFELQKPWIESTEKLIEKASELSEEATPKQYKEFYDEWIETYQNSLDKFNPIPTMEANREKLEKFMSGTEELSKLYKTWLSKLEDNSQSTKELLKDKIDPAKYKEYYDMWMNTYEQLFDELLALSTKENNKEIFEKYTGIPHIYFSSFIQMAKLWRTSYSKLYEPWTEAIDKLSMKMANISRGKAGTEAYKNFYELWMETYKDTYDKYIESMKPTKGLFDNFTDSTHAFLNMYKSWMAALEKMADKTHELSKEHTDAQMTREFFVLWTKMYEKAFDTFFEDMPMAGPMKDMMEPVKIMSKMYSDTFLRMSKLWFTQDYKTKERAA